MNIGKLVINFSIFKMHKVLQRKKLISCVMFFILMSLINIRRIEFEVGDFIKESVRVSVKTVSRQVSFIYRIYLERFSRVFVGASEGVLVKEQRTRGDEIGERTGEGNSLMASVGYLMAADVYEMEREIREYDREGVRVVTKF